MRHILRKINLKTMWLYVGAALLIISATPTKTSLTVGLALIILGEGIRVWSAGYLQKNQILVTSGPYSHVKNPLYIGTILITAGFCIMANNIYLLTLAFLGFIFYYIPYKKQVEGNRLKERFGEAYVVYDEQVNDYMPRLKPYQRGEGTWRIGHVIENSEEGIVALVILGVFLVGLRFWF